MSVLLCFFTLRYAFDYICYYLKLLHLFSDTMTVWRTTARIMKRLSIGNILELEGIIVDNREGRACLKTNSC